MMVRSRSINYYTDREDVNTTCYQKIEDSLEIKRDYFAK